MKIQILDQVRKNILLPWDELPEFMKTLEVYPYWEMLNKKRSQLVIKRIVDVILSITMIVALLIPMIIIAVAVKLDSHGSILYRQVRITSYGRRFKINKFRTMLENVGEYAYKGQQTGALITVANDNRVTSIGKMLRKYRLDELPQLFNVLIGDMSFVGTRPEVPKYVEEYRDEWNATLLMPAGITSECSIKYKDEEKLLEHVNNIDDVYINMVLPEKMKWNLNGLKNFGLLYEVGTMIKTVLEVCRKD